MDRLIKRFDAEADGDLMVVEKRGVAYQRDMSKTIAYDDDYFKHYVSLAGSETEARLNAGRVAMLLRHIAGVNVLDVGIGNGSFIQSADRAGLRAMGLDVNPAAVDWLQQRKLLASSVRGFDAVTFWDSLEHMETPEVHLSRIAAGARVFVALPIFESLDKVRNSKHYKPGEHLYYWTATGFVDWMRLHGFRFLEQSNHEVEAGREAIGAFAFVKEPPEVDRHIEAYAQIHATRFYGSSASELHLDLVTDVVHQIAPRSILDFGCGRSDLVAHFYHDGRRKIARYDPAIPRFKELPAGRFDLVLCCDVLEHIPMAALDNLFDLIKTKTHLALFTISMKPAKARMPDGSNAHCTLLTSSEWHRWLKDAFGEIEVLPSMAEHECNVLAGSKRKVRSQHRTCRCGGEVVLDIYHPPKRPVEHFMRCTRTGWTSEPAASELAAVSNWEKSK